MASDRSHLIVGMAKGSVEAHVKAPEPSIPQINLMYPQFCDWWFFYHPPVIDKSNTVYEHKLTMVQNYTFLFIRCPFCQEQYIYEMGLIYHIMYSHIAIQNNIKKRVRHSEDLLITIASAITELSVNTDSLNSISLFHYVKSYGIRTPDVNTFNNFIIENSGAIQCIVNSKTNASNNFYIIKYLQFIYVLSRYTDKKILQRETQAVKHYTQYLTSSKQINHIQPQNNNNHSMPQKLFKKIQKIPAPSKFNTTDINFITTIPSLDYFILNTISYNNKQQIIDDLQIPEKHLLTHAYKKKKYLSKLHLILKYINKFKYLTNGILDENNKKIMNFLQFININNLLSLEKLLRQFEDEMDSWRPNHVISLSYEPTRIHSSTNIHSLIIDQYEVLQFSIPASNDCNHAIILVCLIRMETRRTLLNIYDHIKIIMCVIKFNFIDKKSFKKILKELVFQNYLTIEFITTHIIYNLNMEQIMEEINKNINTNKYINQIMTISRETYYTTGLPHNFNPKNKIKKHSQYNNNNIFNRFQTKIIYTQQYIENILHTNFNNITTNNIEEHYINEIKN
ncbi:Uncharacterized protein FWK35_00024360 [Aphis craccivora]|uniref:C2H2-type domain-containing protein n=1 Tax=Aphis craccivora TaxID=307492 RepID=A0A6G0XJJ6_APHCR|nr:Uncharacterized protein FWK35_00024360 [Aphis craccivora]